jgi:acetyltransferase (GNAT) family protein
MDRLTTGFERLEFLLKEPNVKDLITDYWEELSPIKDVAKLDPDWPRILGLEKAGIFRVWSVRVTGTLAGFILFHVQPHIFCRTTLFAIEVGHFLGPAFRGNGRVGYHMWKSALVALKDEGAKVVWAHDNASRPLLPFFLQLGFEPRSTMFWKVIE